MRSIIPFLVFASVVYALDRFEPNEPPAVERSALTSEAQAPSGPVHELRPGYLIDDNGGEPVKVCDGPCPRRPGTMLK